jgi:hypothetical protein
MAAIGKATKREPVDTGGNKLYVRRNARGTSFKEVEDVGRSPARDRRQTAKAVAPADRATKATVGGSHPPERRAALSEASWLSLSRATRPSRRQSSATARSELRRRSEGSMSAT